MLACPEVDEAEDLVGLLAFAEIGVGVAEDVAVGVLGEEGEDGGLSAAALGEVVGLDLRVVAEVGHGVEVEIEGLRGEDVVAGDLVVPPREQALDLAGRDARGMLGQKALLWHGVEAAEEAEPGVCDEGHDMALALDRPQLEGDGGAQGVLCGDHLGTRQLGLVGEGVDCQADHVWDEQEEAAEACGELAWQQREAAAIGDGFDGGPGMAWPLVVAASRQSCEAFVLQDLSDCGGAERGPLFLEGSADVVDRVVALAQGNDLLAATALVGL